VQQELCSNGWSKSKVRYKTKAAATKAARRTKSGLAIFVYSCRHCGCFHLTSEAQRNKAQAPPSASKLRRQLANAAAQIKASEKRLTAAERAYFEELDFVAMETARLFGSVTSR